MRHHSKRYNSSKEKVALTSYNLHDAIEALKQQKATKFVESIELHIRLGINAKKSDQVVRGSVQLPHGTGKTKKLIAFVGSNFESDAKEAGADIIGTAEEITKIKQTGKVDFEVAIATPDMMKTLAPIARILGQKGLMPNPKTETVGTDVKKMIQAVKAGKVNFKNDDTANLHLAVGKMSFDSTKLEENISAALEAIKKSKPAGAKGIFIKSATICSTMGPALPITLSA
jgi:large subunit ribosomal protein L1